MVNGVLPCLVLNIVTLVAYFLPSDTQINLVMTCFLTFSVNLIVISSEIPVQSDYLPVVSIYFLFSIIHSLTSIIWFTFISHCDRTNYLPMVFEWITSKALKNKVKEFDSKNELMNKLNILNRIVFWIILMITILAQLFIWISIYF
jgi:hypothetical protein